MKADGVLGAVCVAHGEGVEGQYVCWVDVSGGVDVEGDPRDALCWACCSC